MQQRTEVIHQNLARRHFILDQPTILNEISEKDDFKTLTMANSDCNSSGQKEATKQGVSSVQHTLTPTQCPDSDLKKAIEQRQIFAESEVIIKGRNLLD